MELICFALIVAQVVYLAACYVEGSWLTLRNGGGVPSDFVNVWAAGRMALAGHAASVYDWPTHKLDRGERRRACLRRLFRLALSADLLVRRRRAVAHSLRDRLGASGPSAPFPPTSAAVRAIIGDRVGYLLAAAFPAVLANFIVGQNGFLTAGLIGGALMLIERRPVARRRPASGF